MAQRLRRIRDELLQAVGPDEALAAAGIARSIEAAANRADGTFDTSFVVGSASTVVSRIQHAVDGAAIATVTINEVPGSLTLVHTGALTIFSGRLRLGDADSEQTDACELPTGTYELRGLHGRDEAPDASALRPVPLKRLPLADRSPGGPG